MKYLHVTQRGHHPLHLQGGVGFVGKGDHAQFVPLDRFSRCTFIEYRPLIVPVNAGHPFRCFNTEQRPQHKGDSAFVAREA